MGFFAFLGFIIWVALMVLIFKKSGVFGFANYTSFYTVC